MPENPAPNGPAADGTAPAATPVNAPAVTPATPAAPAAPADNPPGYEALGDPGKRALDAMKAERNAERDQRKALEARIAELEAAPKTDPRADRRIVRTEIKAAAKDLLADPTDALTFLNLDDFKVTEDGEVDAQAISTALEELLKNKPHLAASPKRPKFEGSADNGSQGRQPTPGQMTREEVKRLAAAGRHAEIAKAKSEGRLNSLLGLNQ